jgi:hypothetical protein
VNGFDVQAIGWIVTRDLCTELARSLLGLRPRLERAALDELASRWLSLNAAVLGDQRTRSYAAQMLWPRRVRLSERSEAKLKAFIAELVAFSPRMYGYQGLRGRCFEECIQLVASFLCSVMLGRYGSTDIPTFVGAGVGRLLSTGMLVFRGYSSALRPMQAR